MKTFKMNSEENDTSSSDSELFFNDNINEHAQLQCFGCPLTDIKLINCSVCKRTYHNECHIPPLPETMTYTNKASFKSLICTLCIDIDHTSKVMIEGTKDPNQNTLDENEIIMASRILLELIIDKLKSSKRFYPDYYRVIFRPVYKVKKRLFKEKYYASFTDVVCDMKRIYSNAIFYYCDYSHPSSIMAQYQERMLNKMLAKWVPQC